MLEQQQVPSQKKAEFTRSELNYLYNLGVKNFKTKSYSRALSVFEVLTSIDPINNLYMKAMAGTYHAMKNYLAAIVTYNYCYGLDSSTNNDDCIFYTAVCLFESGDFTKARIEFDKFLAKKETNAPELNKQAELFLLAIEKQFCK